MKAAQIGKHIYHINPTQEKVYVLPVSKAKEYASLIAEDVSNKNIAVYSTGEEVLTLVNNGQASQATTRCKETGIGGQHLNVAVEFPSSIRAYADFDRYGIYFQLWASISPTMSGIYEFDFTPGVTQGYILYKPRCQSRIHYGYSGEGTHNNSTQKYTAYSSSRSLNEVYFYYRVKKKSTQTHVTELFGFRVNY